MVKKQFFETLNQTSNQASECLKITKAKIISDYLFIII